MDHADYQVVKSLAEVLGSVLRRCRDLDQLWPVFSERVPQSTANCWQTRDARVLEDLEPALAAAEEAAGATRADKRVEQALARFDSRSVHIAWERALERREGDDERGVPTAARSLLETACKHILDDRGIGYAADASLPALYAAAAGALGVAPKEITDPTLRKLAGAASKFVDALADLRKTHGDAHGVGREEPAELPEHYRALAVDLAGAVAAFLARCIEQEPESDIPF